MVMRSRSGLQPHERLLATCAATRQDETIRSAIDQALSAPGLDWGTALRTAMRHGVAQIASKHLDGFRGDGRIPEPVMACFDRMYRGNRLRNQVLFRETGRFLRALEA